MQPLKVCHESPAFQVLSRGYAARVNTHISDPSASWLIPDWPAIDGVQTLFTSRDGGQSMAPWDSMNLGDHVGDTPQAVAANRQVLADVMTRRSQTNVRPVFLQQVHGWDVQLLDDQSQDGQPFDACVSDSSEIACTIMVADCLPVLIAHRSGLVVGAAHAGWRGLAGQQGHGVLEALWQAYQRKLQTLGFKGKGIASETQVWLGPCIGPQAFEVGNEVRQVFTTMEHEAAPCFIASPFTQGHWLADLPQLARLRLQKLGLQHIYGNNGSSAWCTVSQPSRFFSHRRDARLFGTTGRMAACIWRG